MENVQGNNDDNANAGPAEPQNRHDIMLHERASIVKRFNHWLNFLNLPAYEQPDLHALHARIGRRHDLFEQLERVYQHIV